MTGKADGKGMLSKLSDKDWRVKVCDLFSDWMIKQGSTVIVLVMILSVIVWTIFQTPSLAREAYQEWKSSEAESEQRHADEVKSITDRYAQNIDNIAETFEKDQERDSQLMKDILLRRGVVSVEEIEEIYGEGTTD